MSKLSTAFLAAFLTTQSAFAAGIDNIGQMDTGMYALFNKNTKKCVLAVGNYSWGNAGRGYAAMDCEKGFDFNNVSGLYQLNETDIGKLDSGTHNLNLNVVGQEVDCDLIIGNYSFGSSGRGYAAMTCNF